MSKKLLFLILTGFVLASQVNGGIIVPTEVRTEDLNAYSGTGPTELIDNSGMDPEVNAGDSYDSALLAKHAYSAGFNQSYVTNGGGSDYSSAQNPPVIIWDLTGGGNTRVGSLIVWQYENMGGGVGRCGNHTKTIELQFNTEADGDSTFSGEVTTITAKSVFELDEENIAQAFPLSGKKYRYVRMALTDNHFGSEGIIAGGDRIGLGEVRFANEGSLASPALASIVLPDDDATDVDRDTVLLWEPGEYAVAHDVYLGTDFNDVNNADRTNPLDVLVSQNQVPNSYDPGRLQLETTYYWRIDEVNAAPDNTIFKGDTWSFIVEPVAYPIQGVAVTASSAAAGADANNTTNESGLTDDLHSNESAAMWLSEEDPVGASIQYEFDKAYKLHELWVWNHNTPWEMVLGYGAKNVTIETSTDANNWTALGDFEFARADGTNTYAHNTTIDFAGTVATHVRLNIKSNWGGLTTQYGLSEVRFNYTPVAARYPVPADGQTDLPLDVALDWRAGREAVQHKVYLGSDQQAVADGSDAVLIATADNSEYTVNALGLGETYYWKIDEVNEAETPATRQGEVWTFSTQESLVVDDFESYNDIPVGEDGSSLVYMTWADGFENTANGSTIGYFEPFQPTMETSIVHDGKQSVPLYYDNTVAGHSEATAKIADLAIGQDWSKHGIKSLSLWFYGDPNNAVTEQMYVKINGAKVLYDGDAANLASTTWQPWNIELADFGVNLSSVTEISIGFERSGATGGEGMVLLDALRLYSYSRELITPVEPDQAALVGHWKFDEGSGTTAVDSSGNGNNGTVVNAIWTAGKNGNALEFTGTATADPNTYVSVPAAAFASVDTQLTVAFWTYTDSALLATNTIIAAYADPNATGRILSAHLPWGSTVYFDTGEDSTGYDRISKGASTSELTDAWVHWALVKNADTGDQMIYRNGILWHSEPSGTNTRPINGARVTAFTIGARVDITEGYVGMIDDVRLYNSALSEEGLAWLAGRIKPYDKPF